MIISGNMHENKQFLSPASVSVLRSVENIPRYSNSKICLFGKPDEEFTNKLIADHIKDERQRILDRWGFDILSEKFRSPKKSDSKHKRRSQKALLEDKENIQVGDENGRTLLVGDAMKENVDSNNRKKSLKITNDRHLRKARQSQVTDFWRSRKFSESSSGSDKEN